MKQLIFNRLFFCLVLVLCSHITWAAEVTKERKIKKSFKVDNQTTLEVSNQFGQVHINTTAQNEFRAEIIIKVTQTNEERAQEIMDKIEIDFEQNQSNNLVSMKTRLNNINNKKGSFSIDYLLYIPVANPIKVVNKFGDLYLDETNGNCEIDVSYGNLKTEVIKNNAQITLSFGSGESSVKRIKDGDFLIKYSNLNLEQAENLDLNSQFSEIDLGVVKELKLQCNYGKLALEQVNRMEGEVKFSDFKLDRLINNIDIELSYAKNFRIGEVDHGYNDIYIKAGFSSIELTLPKKPAVLSASLQFGNFNYDPNSITMTQIEKGHTSSDYEGWIMSKNGKSNVDLSAKYGNIKVSIK